MLSYDMNAHGENPLYVHLCACIRNDIEAGAIAPHEKLPSKRALARNLDVAVVTVEAAYAQLIAEGYLYAEPRRGYFACELQHANDDAPDAADEDATSPLPSHDRAPARRSGAAPAGRPPISQAEARRAAARSWTRADAPKREAAPRTARSRFDLSPEAVSSEAFPFALWTKMLRDTLALEPKETLIGAGDPRGEERLRRAIADHLRRTRGFCVDPDCIVVGAGSQVLFALVAQLFGRPARVAVENPCSAGVPGVYEAHGLSVRRIPLDEHGMDIDALRACGCTLAHVGPSHQFPTGIAMPVSRRYELLAWAGESPDRYIVEDDFDSECRLAGKPLPTLASIDGSGRVIYANTFSKTLGPGFRIAYLVLPRALRDAFADRLGFYSCTVSAIEQIALARFMERGDFERFVNRTKTRCRAVRDTLVDAIEKTPAAQRIAFENADAGLHLVMRIEAKSPERPAKKPEAHAGWQRPSACGGAARKAAEPESEPERDDDAKKRLEDALVRSLARQDVRVAALSSFDAAAAGLRADEETAEPGRIACRLVVGFAALSETQARAAAEALWRGIAPFI